jgi:hypothetical protein
MKYSLLIILVCLVLACPVHAAVFPCSNNSSGNAYTGSNADIYGVVMIKTTPTGATVTVDPGLNTSYTQTSMYMAAWGAGIHSFTVSLAGYKDVTGQFNSCPKRMTYIDLTLSPLTLNYSVRRIGTFVVAGTTTPVQGTTTLPVSSVTTLTQVTPVITQPVPAATGTTPPQDTLGSLSVTTTPAGAFIFLDGVQRGVSPATIPGLSAGTHTVLLKIDGYQDLSTPVVIAAGKTQDYATSLVKNSANSATTVATANATAGTTKGVAPGFEAVLGIIAIGAILAVRRIGRK